MMDAALPSCMLADRRLWRFLAEMTSGKPIPIDMTEPPWFEPGVVNEIPVETYFSVLERSCPSWRFGSLFVSGEDFRRVFWRQEQKFFGRELTAEESRRFGELAKRFLAWRSARSPQRRAEVDQSCVCQFQDRLLRWRQSCCRRHGVRRRYARIGPRRRVECPGRDDGPLLA